MEVMILDPTDDIEMLRTIGEEWAQSAHGSAFSFPIDVGIGLATMRGLVDSPMGDVLVLESDGRICGFLGQSRHFNHVGPGMIANECCFYVTPSARSGGIRLIHAFEKLAKAKGCSFSTLNASKIAGDADRTSRLYGNLGYAPFETTHIKAL